MRLESLTGPYRILRDWVQGTEAHERTRELIGMTLAREVVSQRSISSLHEVEFRVHSQFGDDGIIQWLVSKLPGLPKRFVEFGVEDYSESNTRFLMVNNKWSGLVMDGSAANIDRLRRRRWFWRHDLTAVSCFVTRENVDRMIADWAAGDGLGLLHIDVDGNDYWLWDAVTSASPFIVIMEFNPLFGCERAITVPYSSTFRRFDAHYSGQYAGASLAAMAFLANRKGYALIGTNSAGNNAYFVRTDVLNDEVRATTPSAAFVQPHYRESRDTNGRLDYLSYADRQGLIRGLPVVNVMTDETEPF